MRYIVFLLFVVGFGKVVGWLGLHWVYMCIYVYILISLVKIV